MESESPVRHGRRSPHKCRELVHDLHGRRPSKEVEVQDTPDDLEWQQVTTLVFHVHTIRIHEQKPVRLATFPHIQIEGERAVRRHINGPASNIRRKQRVRRPWHQTHAIRARRLAQSIQEGVVRQKGGEFQILVLEHERIVSTRIPLYLRQGVE